MTSSHEPETAAARQGRLLLRIQSLATEQRRLTDTGPSMFADSGGAEPPEMVWQQRLDHLAHELVETEHQAQVAGVDRGWIDDARELGSRAATTPERSVVRQHPDRATEVQEFYLGMLEVDLWHLERMAGLDAARTDRIATGRWSFDDPPQAQHQFYANMFRHHERITVLAAAAQITRTEGELIWGRCVEGIRRAHIVAVSHLDETALAGAWNTYAQPDPMLRVPPYVPHDPLTNTPTSPTLVVPPSPRQMLTDATAALRAEFVAASLAQADPIDQGAVISAAVDAALPTDHELSWEPDPTSAPGPTTGIGRNYTAEP
ncbi:hypothetical protein ACIA5E_18450 [Nocardia asteroides]|uniref:hypothetical protein n=1 Tax=Nocardia asteroides TaxID=1824 RepID=UPI0037A2B61A